MNKASEKNEKVINKSWARQEKILKNSQTGCEQVVNNSWTSTEGELQKLLTSHKQVVNNCKQVMN